MSENCISALWFVSTVKAGGKRIGKKSLEDGATHGTPETKRSDELSRALVVYVQHLATWFSY